MSLQFPDALHAFYRMGRSFSAAILQNCFGLEVYNKHYIPKSGPFLFASNHASYFDPPILGGCMRQPLFYFAKRNLFGTWWSSWFFHNVFCIPVDRNNPKDVNSIRSVFKVLKAGHPLVIFPEGTRSKTGELLKAKPGVGMIACKSGVPVVPVRIFNSGKAWPSGGLPDFSQNITVVIGKPMEPEEFDLGAKDPNRAEHAANTIMSRIASMELPVDRGC